MYTSNKIIHETLNMSDIDKNLAVFKPGVLQSNGGLLSTVMRSILSVLMKIKI